MVARSTVSQAPLAWYDTHAEASSLVEPFPAPKTEQNDARERLELVRAAVAGSAFNPFRPPRDLGRSSSQNSMLANAGDGLDGRDIGLPTSSPLVSRVRYRMPPHPTSVACRLVAVGQLLAASDKCWHWHILRFSSRDSFVDVIPATACG